LPNSNTPENSKFRLLESLLIVVSISFVLYKVFYYFSPIIWSKNIHVNPNTLMPPVAGCIVEPDGVEAYVLYALVIVNLLLSFVAYLFIKKIKNATTHLIILLFLEIVACLYFFNIGLHFLCSSNEIHIETFFVTMGFVLTLFFLYIKYDDIIKYIILIGLIPICFIATDFVSTFDYGFVLAPALKISDGIPLSDIYMQYDLLLSLFAALLVKLNIDIYYFQVLGQYSFYLFFCICFFFARRFLALKSNSILLLITLVLVRYFAINKDPFAIPQVTPLRLDLWLVLLLLVYYKGVYHWLLGFALGLLFLFHKNFGLIYLSCYLLLIFSFFLIAVMDEYDTNKGMNFDGLKKTIKQHFNINSINAIIILFFVGFSYIVFGGLSSKSVQLYGDLGIGMSRIQPVSFYWYAPVLFGLILLLLFFNRRKLSLQYFSTGLFLIFLAAGNSLYFFGRSHEHNILNISGALVLALFLFLDLLYITPLEIGFLKEIVNKPIKGFRIKSVIITTLALLFIGTVAYNYSYKISEKTDSKINYLKGNRPLYYPISYKEKLKIIQEITNNDSKVYFAMLNDVPFYYYGKYKIQGYYNPYCSWVYKENCMLFLQELLDKGYYIVSDCSNNYFKGVFPNLRYNEIKKNGWVMAIRKKPAP